MLETRRAQTKERAQRTAQRKADEAKAEFGRLAFDALEDYFPEQARQRRRRNGAQLLVVGLAVGLLLGYLAGR